MTVELVFRESGGITTLLDNLASTKWFFSCWWGGVFREKGQQESTGSPVCTVVEQDWGKILKKGSSTESMSDKFFVELFESFATNMLTERGKNFWP